MARLAITIEGGLISSDLVEQIAATPQDVPGQGPRDFGLDARLSDEIQKAFSDALIHWNAFNARLTRGQGQCDDHHPRNLGLAALGGTRVHACISARRRRGWRWYLHDLPPSGSRSGRTACAHRLLRAGA